MNKKQIFSVILFIIASFFPFCISAQDLTVADQKARETLNKMTIDEKLSMLGGVNEMNTCEIPRLGIKSIHMYDGPQGVRIGKSTAYPCAVMLAATWNDQLAYYYGHALGGDCRARGLNIILGPAVNIYRSPCNARNFEYMGEDPLLSGRIATGYIKGVQSNKGVIACIKHFAANNPEKNRTRISSDVDERTLQEIYLPAFKAGVQQGGVGSIMSSYNLINGIYTAENEWLMHTILRSKWGFPFLSMTDWGAAKHSFAMARHGVDLEMPSYTYMKPSEVKYYLKTGDLSMKNIDEKVLNILRTAYYFHLFENTEPDKSIALDNKENSQVAYNVAAEGFVLLKNQGKVLPIKSSCKRIAVIGHNAKQYVWGGGSGSVYPYHQVPFFNGIQTEAVRHGIQVDYIDYTPTSDITSSVCYTATGMSGFDVAYYNGIKLSGNPIFSHTEKTIDHKWNKEKMENLSLENFSMEAKTTVKVKETGTYIFCVSGDDGFSVKIGENKVIDDWNNGSVREKFYKVNLEAGKAYPVKVKYFQATGDAILAFSISKINENFEANLVKKLNRYNLIIACEGFNESNEHEGDDRSFELPTANERLLEAAVKSKIPVVAVMNAGGNIESHAWEPKLKALIWAWYAGQEGGTALANILFGKVNPSGKLPMTFEKKAQDNPTYANYQDQGGMHVKWTEGIFVGYRGYEHNHVIPLYPFGYGLSYTTFKLSGLKIGTPTSDGTVVVSFTLKNTGKRKGSEVVQIYVGKDGTSPVERPIKELKQFAKISLQAGQNKQINFKLNKEAFKYYDVKSHNFVTDTGNYNIFVGTSSQDIRLKGKVKVD